MFRKLAMVLAAPLFAVSACATEAQYVVIDPIAAVRAAPAVAAESGSGRFEMTVALAGPESTVEVLSTGAFSGDRVMMEVDLGAVLAGALGSSAIGSLPEGFDQPLEVVVDGATTYLRAPMLAGLLGTTGWLSATGDDLAATGAPSLPFVTSTGDPSQLLEVLRGVAGDVEEVGTEDVRGVPTTRYHATVDLARALDQLPSDQGPELERQLRAFGTELSDVPVDVWLDDDGLAHRLVIDLQEVSGRALGSTARAMVTLELFDYGDAVVIEVPPPGETTQLADVLGSFEGIG